MAAIIPRTKSVSHLLRRLLRFRLSTWFCGVTLIAAAAGWFVRNLEQARRQRAAVEWFGSQSAGITYDYQCDLTSNVFDNRRVSPVPKFLRDWLGDDFFHDVVYVELYESGVREEDLRRLSVFPELEFLNLEFTNSGLTEHALVHLAPLKRLRRLYMRDILISGATLPRVTELQELEELRINCSFLTDDEVQSLSGLRRLRDLSITKIDRYPATRLTSAGIERLRHSMPKCKFSVNGS